MANKTFADFTTKGGISVDPINDTDYIVGYRPGTTNVEVKISAQNLANSLDDLLDDLSLAARLVRFEGTDIKPEVSVNDKLEQFYTTDDYKDLDTASLAALGERLFVPYGSTVVINLTTPNDSVRSILNIFNNIKKWHIEGTVQIKLSAGDWNLNQTLNLNHPYGQNIQLIGDVTVPANVKLLMDNSLTPGGFDIITCSNGSSFGLINGVTITGLGNTLNAYAAIKADGGAFIQLGSKVVITNCRHGIMADRGSIILADYVETKYCAYGNGFYASNRSHISATYANSNHNLAGYLAENHSQINAEYSQATYNTTNGYNSYSNSQIDAKNATSSLNTRSGFYAQTAGEIECYNAVALSNGRYGMEFNTYGVINGSSNLTSSIYTSLTTWNDNAAVSSSVGKLYIKTPDSNSILFNTYNSFTQFEISNANSAVSHVRVTGADSNGHSLISVNGAENSSDPVGLKLYPGTDAKYIDLGTNVRFGAYTTQPLSLSNGTSASGYITCQDSNGNSRRLLVL